MISGRRRGRDLTKAVFVRQLLALGARRFELGIKFEGSDSMQRREGQSVADLIRCIPYLKYRNLNGHHIYIRPGAREPCVLLDDLTVSRLIQLDKDGLQCACIVQTSEFNYQAWIRLGGQPLMPALATCLGEVLAQRYGADPGSTDFRHFGRAAGFTNVKPKHRRDDGRFPFTRLEEVGGAITPHADALIAQARARLKEKRADKATRRDRFLAVRSARSTDATRAFAHAVAFVFDTYGQSTDPSRADAAAARHLLISGYSPEAVERAMFESDDIRSRRPKTFEDYVERTMHWATGAAGNGRRP